MTPEVLNELRLLSSADFDATVAVDRGPGRRRPAAGTVAARGPDSAGDPDPHATDHGGRLARGTRPNSSIMPWPRQATPTLMTAELRDTLVDHSAGNYRLLMTMGAELLGLRHGPRSPATRREVLPGGVSGEAAPSRGQEESEGLTMPGNLHEAAAPATRTGSRQAGTASGSLPVVRSATSRRRPGPALAGRTVLGRFVGRRHRRRPQVLQDLAGARPGPERGYRHGLPGQVRRPRPGPGPRLPRRGRVADRPQRVAGMARHRGLDSGAGRHPRHHRPDAAARSRATPRRHSGDGPAAPARACCCSIRWCGCTASTRTTPAKWPGCWPTSARLQRQFDLSVMLVHHTRKNAAAESLPGRDCAAPATFMPSATRTSTCDAARTACCLSSEHRAAPASPPGRLCNWSRPIPRRPTWKCRRTSRRTASRPAGPGAFVLAEGVVLTRAKLRDALAVKNERLGEALESLEQAGRLRRTSAGWRRLD